MSERNEGRRSPLTGEEVPFVVSDSAPKLRLRLERIEQLNRNAFINFGLLCRPKEASPLQAMVFLLLRFDGWAHNGGLGHGFEVLEGTRKSQKDLLEMMSQVGAHLHQEAVEADDEKAYYRLQPDLPEILVGFARRNLAEFTVVTAPQAPIEN